MMQEREIISVIMPSYNSAATIVQSVESVLSQPIPLELIVQDGGSTDGTLDLLRPYLDFMSLESKPDSGQSQALNRALERATGKFIGWLNADDIYSPGALPKIVDAMHSSPSASVFYGDFTMIDGEGTTIRKYSVSPWNPDRFYLKGCYVWSGALFVSRSIYYRSGNYDESLSYCMDYDFLLRIADNVTAAHVPHQIGAFRIHAQSKSGGSPFRFVPESYRVLRTHAGNSRKRQGFAAVNLATQVAYLSSRRLWHSNTWRRLREEKTL